jgi:hypothetical protein
MNPLLFSRNEFKTNRPPHSLSAEFFATALLNLNSDEVINHFINDTKSLLTIKDVFIQKEFYKIVFHILGKHRLHVVPIDNNTIFNHISKNPITENFIILLADFIYGISEISNEEYLIIDTLLYSIINNSENYRKICDMVHIYNPS